ncbi:MAG: O-antigen ligase family protein [Desulfobulbaceae bacterium]|nr:O-antigen ligase family protein [Desulfobulbaceae bacterium]
MGFRVLLEKGRGWSLANSVMLLLGIMAFLTPFAHTQTILEVSFYLAVLVAGVVVMRGERLDFDTPLLLPFVLFGAWGAVSVIFALDVRDSLSDYYAHFLKYILFYYLLFNFFKSKQKLVWLSWVFIVSGTVLSVFIMVYFYVVQGNDLSTRLAHGLTYYPVNQIGYATVFSFLLASHCLRCVPQWYQRVLLAFSCIATFAASLLSQSRGTMVALVLSFIILSYKNKKLMVALVTVALLFVALGPVKARISSSADRVALALFSAEIIKDHPVTGTGFSIDTFHNTELIDHEKYKGRIPAEYRNVVKFLWPHNMLLDIAVRTGVIGCLLYVMLLATVARVAQQLMCCGGDSFIQKWGQCISASLCLFVAKGLFEPSFFHNADMVFYSICSMASILWWLDKEGELG